MEEFSSDHDDKDREHSSFFRNGSPNQENDDDGKKKRLRREIESLHQEMEVTGYAKGKKGHKQRKVPRDISKVRTQKRKLLEKLDERESAILGDEDEAGLADCDDANKGKFKAKRLRGSRAAAEDSVIQGSLIFSAPSSARRESDDNFHSGSVEEECEVDIDIDEVDDVADTELGETDPTNNPNDGQDISSKQSHAPKQLKVSKGSKSNGPSSKKRRKMYRLRNFQSLKMAQKHGNAIAAHARGQPRLAIEQLKVVAKEAPSAPQVYSSLGMVYGDMLRESRKLYKEQLSEGTLPPYNAQEITEAEKGSTSLNSDGITEVLIPNRSLAEQRILATKAYGSYHVAAILCKKDFTLWVRAADSALEIAEVHHEVMSLPELSKKLCQYHLTERRRWHEEALRDYIVADNLKPPGIDVPAKLALMHIELGNLSEALTILTDLKNRAGYEFHSSYKAWMLYSDLMLRLGHECIQWSKGIQTNQNYMFRRWLRKFSKIFDWQERRLQGLSLAFEAAAGTENAKDYLAWLQNRIIETTKSATDSDVPEINGSIQNQSQSHSQHGISESIEPTQAQTDDDISQEIAKSDMKSQLAREKELILSAQSRELEAFDKTTTEMNLTSGSTAATERTIARNLLSESHDLAMSKFLKDCNKKELDHSLQTKEATDKIIGMNTSPLPISGSIRQVCSIASELMKHLLGLELYKGAKLVGDAVSCYMKERARRYHDGIKAKRTVDEWQQKISDSPFFIEGYDDNHASSNEIDLPYLSDEENLLDDTEDSPLVKSLSDGALTPELRVLYGLALIGEGGRNFIAAKCLEAINHLQEENEQWFSDAEIETKQGSEPFWLLFRRAMTEELDRTGAYAFIADLLKKMNKEREWAFHFSSYFRNHLETLKDRGLIDRLMNLDENDLTPYKSFRKNQVLKVILEACKFDVYTINESGEIKHALNKRPSFDVVKQIGIAQGLLTSIVNIIPFVWSVEDGGVLSPICVELVKVVAKCVRWLSATALNELPYSTLNHLVDQCTVILSYLCGHSIPQLNDINKQGTPFLEGAECYPVQSSWQSAELRMLSICTYNFAVACNVSLFSGWEKEEFTMKVLKKRCGQNRHVGVHIRDRRLAGFLPKTVEQYLNQQWESYTEMQPAFPKLDFAGKLETVKQSEWFQTEKKNREESTHRRLIAVYAEEEALELFLGYSSLCTRLSRSETDKNLSTACQQLAMSILLPLSQFCLDETLWDSDIGEAATTISSYEQWQILAGNTKYQPVEDREGLYPKRIRKSGKRVFDKKVQKWIEGVGSATSKDFIAIPSIEFKRIWMQTPCNEIKETKSTDSKMQMQRVQKALSDLRACYTISAAEKACLNLSNALLEVASIQTCNDPFNCLQQAASFASQATKSGNSDTMYRQGLPEMTQCSPREALIILGRADCLQALYFPNEAAYLCSFVARVCRLHRDSGEKEFEWNDRWKIVSIYAFNVSVMIRVTVSNTLDQTMQRAFLTAWERDVVEELERARRDGRSWMNSLSKLEDKQLENVTAFDSSGAEVVEGFKEMDQSQLQVASDTLPLGLDEDGKFQHEQFNAPVEKLTLGLDEDGKFEPEQLNATVEKLLNTEIEKCDVDDNSLDGVVPCSI